MKNIYYKFLPPNRITYLDDELLRFTQPLDLNDPFECIPKKITQEELQESIKVNLSLFGLEKILGVLDLNKFNKNLIDAMYKDSKSKVNNDIGIFSLSKNWKNCLMWAHYADSYKGFCIGFDKEHDFFIDYLSEDKDKSRHTKEVIYSTERAEIRKSILEELPFDPYITKSTDWKYEGEIRVISTLNLANKTIEKSPHNICLFKVPHNAISEIILGVNVEDEIKNKIIEFAQTNSIKLFESKISEVKFEIERIE